MEKTIFAQFEKGRLSMHGVMKEMAGISWREHKDFPGVFLKDVVTGEQTDGLFTCHLVRIAPDCKIGLHTHAASIELHEVVAGGGVCITPAGEVPYVAGSIGLIACNEPHEVVAGGEGLYLFAKFMAFPGGG